MIRNFFFSEHMSDYRDSTIPDILFNIQDISTQRYLKYSYISLAYLSQFPIDLFFTDPWSNYGIFVNCNIIEFYIATSVWIVIQRVNDIVAVLFILLETC